MQPTPAGAVPAAPGTPAAQSPSVLHAMPEAIAQDPCQAKVLPIIAEIFDGFQGQQELSLLAVQIHLQVQVRL